MLILGMMASIIL
nr:unnamed protein product [Callosobruchus chinensis]